MVTQIQLYTLGEAIRDLKVNAWWTEHNHRVGIKPIKVLQDLQKELNGEQDIRMR